MTVPAGRESSPLDRPLRTPRQGHAEGAVVVAPGTDTEDGDSREDGKAGPPPSGAERAGHGDGALDREPVDRDLTPVLVLLSADWAGPSRPAPTLLRELSRRWGTTMRTLLLEDPDDELLDRWEIEHLPTWLRFVPDHGDVEALPRGTRSVATGSRTDDAAAGTGSGDVFRDRDGAETDRDGAPSDLDPEGRCAADAARARGADHAPGTDGEPPATAAGPHTSRPSEGTVLREAVLSGRTPGGEEITLSGPWRLSHRLNGALPKHAVESELGPSAR